MSRRRNKNRSRSVVHSIECTCDLRHELDTDPFEDHAGSCDLWHSEDFMNGLLDWDPIEGRLVRRFDDCLSDLTDEIWSGDVPMGSGSDMQKIIDATVGGMAVPGKHKWNAGYVSCRHNLTEVRLPDEAGTVIYCSGSMDARQGTRPFRPDWAVYLCGSWSATGMSLFIPWQDYGTPWVEWAQVRWAAQDIYARALAGQRVEIGCMGGHGRTGTLLACLAQLADPNLNGPGSEQWVKKNYCSKAVEDVSQRYFLDWFADPALAPVWVDPTPPRTAVAKSDVTVVGPKGSTGSACNWSRNDVPCCLPLGHSAPHLYQTMKGGKATVGGQVLAAKGNGLTLAQAKQMADDHLAGLHAQQAPALDGAS